MVVSNGHEHLGVGGVDRNCWLGKWEAVPPVQVPPEGLDGVDQQEEGDGQR